MDYHESYISSNVKIDKSLMAVATYLLLELFFTFLRDGSHSNIYAGFIHTLKVYLADGYNCTTQKKESRLKCRKPLYRQLSLLSPVKCWIDCWTHVFRRWDTGSRCNNGHIIQAEILTRLQAEDENTLISFRANFRILDGDTFDASLIDTNSTSYRKKSRSYRELINLLVRRSEHRLGFVGSEILALDGVEENGMSVHFKLHFDRRHANVTKEALHTLFLRLFDKTVTTRSQRFNQLTIDPHSLYVEEPGMAEPNLPPTLEVSKEEEKTEESETITEAPRICILSRLDYCNHENMTSYPNLFGHTNSQQVQEDIVRFREIVDSECSPEVAFSFVCELLQPSCGDDTMALNVSLSLPCRSQCLDFMTQCEARLPTDIKALFVCDNFNVDC
ncbi:hypothetical protein B566_EDAN003840 [Ephemera danica]|nr:hypothetical protein B566_EDAN003840 [Ephemera danica]